MIGIFGMGNNYSPCIKVCKYRDDGHCIGCSMTKTQKKLSKGLKSKDKQLAFEGLIRLQQAQLGGFEGWEKAHKRRYRSKG
tara:strand:+ start:247 stop:489 length:243 start_codon:yes stop_codon:yes gene_type:complete